MATTIGYVDDETEALNRVEDYFLNLDGFNIYTTTNVDEAKDWVISKKIDVLVSDLNMADIDGISLLSEVRKIDQKIPLILFTGFVISSNHFKRLDDIDALIVRKHEGVEYLVKNIENFVETREILNASRDHSIEIREPKQGEGEIHVLIASPSDVFGDTESFLGKIERNFRIRNYERLCGYRVCVHNWTELSSVSGYAQDLINSKLVERMDFIIGVFKHKLGSPTIDINTNRKRAESGSAEELLQALDSNSSSYAMLYFCSTAPVISIDSENLDNIRQEWKRLSNFRQEIQNKILYKSYIEEKELLNIILEDLLKNILTYYTDRK